MKKPLAFLGLAGTAVAQHQTGGDPVGAACASFCGTILLLPLIYFALNFALLV